MAKKKTPDGERCERSLPFKLNDEDKARKGELAAKLNKQLELAQEAKKAEMQKHNAKITDLVKKVSSQLKMINEGIERKAVTCTAVKNFEANKIEFYYEGEIMEAIEMKPGDRQLVLDEKAKKEAKKPNKWQRMVPKKPLHKDADEEPTREDEIASVHKLETSRKGASSSVDPKQ